LSTTFTEIMVLDPRIPFTKITPSFFKKHEFKKREVESAKILRNI